VEHLPPQLGQLALGQVAKVVVERVGVGDGLLRGPGQPVEVGQRRPGVQFELDLPA
jgi:hypothetical protein